MTRRFDLLDEFTTVYAPFGGSGRHHYCDSREENLAGTKPVSEAQPEHPGGAGSANGSAG